MTNKQPIVLVILITKKVGIRAFLIKIVITKFLFNFLSFRLYYKSVNLWFIEICDFNF